MTAARPAWVMLNEVSGSSLPVSVSGHIANFLPFVCLWHQTHSAAQHNVTKGNAKNADDLFFLVMVSF